MANETDEDSAQATRMDEQVIWETVEKTPPGG